MRGRDAPRPDRPDTMWGFHGPPEGTGATSAMWVLDLLASNMKELNMSYALGIFNNYEELGNQIAWAEKNGLLLLPRRMVRANEKYVNAGEDAQFLLEHNHHGILQLYNEQQIEDSLGLETDVQYMLDACEEVYRAGGIPAPQFIGEQPARRFAQRVRDEHPHLAERVVIFGHAYGNNHPKGWDRDDVGDMGFMVTARVFQEEWGAIPPFYITEWGWRPAGGDDGTYPHMTPQKMREYTMAWIDGFQEMKFPNGQEIPEWFRCIVQWIWIPGGTMGHSEAWRGGEGIRADWKPVWQAVAAATAWERDQAPAEQPEEPPATEPEEPIGEDRMKLSEFPRPTKDNGWGIHGGANAWHPLGEHDNKIPEVLDNFEAMGMRWVKLVVKDRTGIPECEELLRRGMMPVVRMYRDRPKPGSIMDAGDERQKDRDAIKDYVALGAKYFELSNEDNYEPEWQGGKFPADIHEAVQISMSDFVKDAEYVLSVGGLPAFPSLTPTDGAASAAHNDIWFYELAFRWLLDRGYRDLMGRGVWISIHNAGLNHPLDYPDDPINQREHQGQTIHTHRYSSNAPTGASNCWRKYEAVAKLFHDAFGFYVPLLSTEGGFWVDSAQDSRYPKLDKELQKELTLQACRMMKTAPAYYFCTGFWLYFNRFGGNQDERWERDAWVGVHGELPIVDALKREPKWEREAQPDPEPEPEPEPDQEPPSVKRVEMLPGVWVEDWRAKLEAAFPWKGKYSLRPNWPIDPLLVGLCFHWDGTANGDEADPIACAREHYNRGWAGIGYRYQVTQKGVIRWLGAPEEISAHAGTSENNRKYLGVLAEPTADGRMTDAQVQACHKLWKAIEKGLGKKLEIVGHREVWATECPGPAWEENRGRIMGEPAEPPPPPDDNTEAIAKIRVQINAVRLALTEIENHVKELR